jgi:spore coat polysaccharide biosynthesis protein SpsF
MANRIGIFLQVRLNSSRMPGKALLNLAGKLLIEHTIERLSVVPADVRVILTTKESEAALKYIAQDNGWEIFCGDAQNVLKR